MAFCPSCRTEYQSGVVRCADCSELLVDVLPESKSRTAAKLVRLAIFPSAAEARLIQELLENNGIGAVLRGGMDPIGNVTGTAPALLVEESALPQAQEIYDAFFAGAGAEPDEPMPETATGEPNPD